MKRVEVVYAYEHDDHASSPQRPQDAAANGVRGVTGFGEVLRKRINVGRKLARAKPGSRIAVRSSRRFHTGLLKRKDHFRTPASVSRSGSATTEHCQNYV